MKNRKSDKQNKNSDEDDDKIKKVSYKDNKKDGVELAEVESENEEEEKVENPKLIIKDSKLLSIGIV